MRHGMDRTRDEARLASLSVRFVLPRSAGPGWPAQSARFLHRSNRIYCRSRSVHDAAVTRLTPEDIQKAREAKQAQAKPVRQKVGWGPWKSPARSLAFSGGAPPPAVPAWACLFKGWTEIKHLKLFLMIVTDFLPFFVLS